MNRRRFLAGAAVTLTAPALVRAASLEYVPRGIVLPRQAYAYLLDRAGRRLPWSVVPLPPLDTAMVHVRFQAARSDSFISAAEIAGLRVELDARLAINHGDSVSIELGLAPL